MGIRQISIGLAAAALLGTTPVMAAAPVTPSVAKLSLTPGANLAVGSRVGAHKSARSSDNSTLRRIDVASSRVLSPGANGSQSSWPKYA